MWWHDGPPQHLRNRRAPLSLDSKGLSSSTVDDTLVCLKHLRQASFFVETRSDGGKGPTADVGIGLPESVLGKIAPRLDHHFAALLVTVASSDDHAQQLRKLLVIGSTLQVLTEMVSECWSRHAWRRNPCRVDRPIESSERKILRHLSLTQIVFRIGCHSERCL
jgi:hypothetical protein